MAVAMGDRANYRALVNVYNNPHHLSQTSCLSSNRLVARLADGSVIPMSTQNRSVGCLKRARKCI
jgi:hypothetical protein